MRIYKNSEELHDSAIKSLSDYLRFCKGDFLIEFWVGGYLRPFDISKGRYQWVLYPHDLSPGIYRLCIMLVSDWIVRPFRAYAMIFAPGEKVLTQYNPASIGYGFNITPAIAAGNSFYLTQNITDFRTRFSGTHLLGVTTLYWSDDVEKTRFEVLLLRKSTVQYIDNTRNLTGDDHDASPPPISNCRLKVY